VARPPAAVGHSKSFAAILEAFRLTKEIFINLPTMKPHNAKTRIWLAVTVTLASVLPAVTALADGAELIAQRLSELGLSSFEEPIRTHYSEGAMAPAMQLAKNIVAMREFYIRQLGIQTPVALGVLNSSDWSRLHPSIPPYGMPFFISGKQPRIGMPAPGGIAFDFLMKDNMSITPEQQAFLTDRKVTFETIAEKQVDAIAFHELGHILLTAYGIDPRCRWLDEFLSTYFGEVFMAKEQGDWTLGMEFPEKPTSLDPPKRPKHTTLEDFEELYVRVDDYIWYQLQFSKHVKEVQSRMGLEFLKEVKRLFPAESGSTARIGEPISPSESLARLEGISPGFQKWAKVFRAGTPVTE
jgi:hypothetical protein